MGTILPGFVHYINISGPWYQDKDKARDPEQLKTYGNDKKNSMFRSGFAISGLW